MHPVENFERAEQTRDDLAKAGMPVDTADSGELDTRAEEAADVAMMETADRAEEIRRRSPLSQSCESLEELALAAARMLESALWQAGYDCSARANIIISGARPVIGFAVQLDRAIDQIVRQVRRSHEYEEFCARCERESVDPFDMRDPNDQ